MRQENREHARQSSESKDRKRAISQQGIGYHKIDARGPRKPVSSGASVNKQSNAGSAVKQSDTKTKTCQDWAAKFPEQHKRAHDRIAQHCAKYPAPEWLALASSTQRAIKKEVISDILAILPDEWRMRPGKTCPAEVLWANGCFRVREDLGEPLLKKSKLASAGSQRIGPAQLALARQHAEHDAQELDNNPELKARFENSHDEQVKLARRLAQHDPQKLENNPALKAKFEKVQAAQRAMWAAQLVKVL